MQVEKMDGILEMPELWSEKKMEKALARRDVKEVHVFNLKPGRKFYVKNRMYKVRSINSKGKEAIVHLDKIRDL